MAIADKLTEADTLVEAALTAVGAKGVSVPAGAKLRQLPGLIGDISTGTPDVPVLGAITITPADPEPGDTLTANISITGTPDSTAYVWRRDTVMVEGETGATITGAAVQDGTDMTVQAVATKVVGGVTYVATSPQSAAVSVAAPVVSGMALVSTGTNASAASPLTMAAQDAGEGLHFLCLAGRSALNGEGLSAWTVQPRNASAEDIGAPIDALAALVTRNADGSVREHGYICAVTLPAGTASIVSVLTNPSNIEVGSLDVVSTPGAAVAQASERNATAEATVTLTLGSGTEFLAMASGYLGAVESFVFDDGGDPAVALTPARAAIGDSYRGALYIGDAATVRAVRTSVNGSMVLSMVGV